MAEHLYSYTMCASVPWKSSCEYLDVHIQSFWAKFYSPQIGNHTLGNCNWYQNDILCLALLLTHHGLSTAKPKSSHAVCMQPFGATTHLPLSSRAENCMTHNYMQLNGLTFIHVMSSIMPMTVEVSSHNQWEDKALTTLLSMWVSFYTTIMQSYNYYTNSQCTMATISESLCTFRSCYIV